LLVPRHDEDDEVEESLQWVEEECHELQRKDPKFTFVLVEVNECQNELSHARPKDGVEICAADGVGDTSIGGTGIVIPIHVKPIPFHGEDKCGCGKRHQWS